MNGDAFKAGAAEADAALRAARVPENQERFRKIKDLAEQYGVAADEAVAAQLERLKTIQKRNELTPVWAKELDSLFGAAALSGLCEPPRGGKAAA